ncbi:IBR domain, a half RING-finger domain-containing protein [Phthorimaea operculella]|nr:IBR domain, a half RING-finger domain-containing protein [Phthorimaea operculella]
MDSEDETQSVLDSENESNGDDFEVAMDVGNRNTNEAHADLEEYHYEVLSTEEIVQHMVDYIKEVNTVVELPATTTHILLNHLKWDKEKLMEWFYDGDQDQLFARAGVINPFRESGTHMLKLQQISTTGTEECQICYTALEPSIMTGLECGHVYCKECWCGYLTTKIMDEGLADTITCVEYTCDILVDFETVMRLVQEPRVKIKYQHFITNSFVECNRLLRWCPSPDCSNAIKVAYVEAAPVTCRCGHTFCFACGENWHEPIKCCLLRKWLKKYTDNNDTNTLSWIAENTKECPKCNVSIEKRGGCNHMICRHCRADFCWLCLRAYNHGRERHECNTYDEGLANERRSQAAIQRYLFFCTRFKTHMQSLSFESKLYATVADKMHELQQSDMSRAETVFLKKAVDILCQCRQTLMYTYVFAYYVHKNNQSAIFEDNQRDLEEATETLSGYLERDITLENVADMKQMLLDKYRYCDSRRKVLLEHVQEGYEMEWWDYTE